MYVFTSFLSTHLDRWLRKTICDGVETWEEGAK